MSCEKTNNKFLDYSSYFEWGLFYGYPLCCIRQFCDESLLGIPSGSARQEKYNRSIPTEHVPCDKCMEEIIRRIGTYET